MSTLNKVILVGNIGQDPITKHFDNGGQVTNISVATTENWKDKNTGEKRELTEWSNVVINGKLSEIAEKYLKKGDKVLIEGKLRTRKWTDTNNVDKYTTEIICREMKMLSSKRQETHGSTPISNQGQNTGKPSENDPNGQDNDDLPF